MSGPAATIPAALRGQHGATAGVAVLRADGTVLGADPVAFEVTAEQVGRSAAFERHRDDEGMRFDDLMPDEGFVPAFLPFRAGAEQRVLLVAVPTALVESFSRPVLVNALGATDGRAAVLDSADRTVFATGTANAGPPEALTRAARSADRGQVSGSYYAVSPVPGTPLRVLLVADEDNLLAVLAPARQVFWQLFAVLAAVVALLLACGYAALANALRVADARLHDGLTGLPNRSLFLERATAALHRRSRTGVRVALLFVDLDGFKAVNDTYGHAGGDALLTEVAARLTRAVRPGDLVARFGGDEFVVLCHDVDNHAGAVEIAERLRQDITRPVQVDGRPVTVGASVGVAVHDGAGTAEDLLQRADRAMYEAKNSGRGRTVAMAAVAPRDS